MEFQKLARAEIVNLAALRALRQAQRYGGGGDLFRRRQRRGIDARPTGRVQARARRAGAEQVHPHRRGRRLRRIGLRQHVERGLGCGIGPAIGARQPSQRRGDEHRAAGRRCAQQRIHGADQLPIGGDVDRDQIVPVLRFDMAERRQRPEDAGIADQHVEAAVALVERQRQAGDAVAILDVERHQRGAAAGRLDLVVELFQAADGARHRDDMAACLRQLQRQRGANAARGAGHQRDTVGEGFGHDYVITDKFEEVQAVHRLQFSRAYPR